MSTNAKEIQELSPMGKLFQVMRVFNTEESVKYGALYKPRSTDIIICTGMASGTTLTQHICHGLRSYGDMSFTEISNVVPCLEQAIIEGYGDLYAPQQYQPHMFKSHFMYRDVPKGAGKYIILVRNPYDAALSLYQFFGNWGFRKSGLLLESQHEQLRNRNMWTVVTVKVSDQICLLLLKLQESIRIFNFKGTNMVFIVKQRKKRLKQETLILAFKEVIKGKYDKQKSNSLKKPVCCFVVLFQVYAFCATTEVF